ncbi:MAG: hypothetical protein M1334_00265 [Patescibacteria group bacterium]|nr:hypothetical protein [Patescibacteria group bacterium]
MATEKEFPVRMVNFLKYFFSVGFLFISYSCFASNHAVLGFAAALALSLIPFVFARTTTNLYRAFVAFSLLGLSLIVLFGNDDYRRITGFGTMFLTIVAFQLGETIFSRKSKSKNNDET